MDKLPMKIDNVLDDIILIVLDGHEPLKELGIDQNKIYVKVVGYDEYGMWVDRPSFQIPIIKNTIFPGSYSRNTCIWSKQPIILIWYSCKSPAIEC